jgi:hypothetical protein
MTENKYTHCAKSHGGSTRNLNDVISQPWMARGSVAVKPEGYTLITMPSLGCNHDGSRG